MDPMWCLRKDTRFFMFLCSVPSMKEKSELFSSFEF
jgi:hypothetical protein